MRNTFFTFLVLFLSGCSVLKTEQARTDDASSRSTSRFLNRIRNEHGKTLAIACYKDFTKLPPLSKRSQIAIEFFWKNNGKKRTVGQDDNNYGSYRKFYRL